MPRPRADCGVVVSGEGIAISWRACRVIFIALCLAAAAALQLLTRGGAAGPELPPSWTDAPLERLGDLGRLGLGGGEAAAVAPPRAPAAGAPSSTDAAAGAAPSVAASAAAAITGGARVAPVAPLREAAAAAPRRPAAGDFLVVAALPACGDVGQFRLVQTAIDNKLPLTLVHSFDLGSCGWLAALAPPLRAAAVASPPRQSELTQEDLRHALVAQHLRKLAKAGNLPAYVLALNAVETSVLGDPWPYLSSASGNQSVFAQEMWTTLRQDPTAEKRLRSWQAEAAFAAREMDVPLLHFDAWGGPGALVHDLLQAAADHVSDAGKELRQAGGGFAALLAHGVRRRGLRVVSDFANVRTTTSHLVFLRPVGEDCPWVDCSCNCVRTAAPDFARTPESLMDSPGGVRWGRSKGAMNIGPYLGLGALPVSCEGCPHLTVFSGARPARLASRTAWPAWPAPRAPAGGAGQALLAVAVVLGQCQRGFQERLVASAQANKVNLTILHDQPGCAWLADSTAKEPVRGFNRIAVDGLAFGHLKSAGDRRFMYLMEFVDHLHVHGHLPSHLLFVDANDAVISGNPMEYFAGFRDAATLFVQEAWCSVQQSAEVQQSFKDWKVDYRPYADQPLLSPGAFGGPAAAVRLALALMKERFLRATDFMSGNERHAGAVFLNDVVRAPNSRGLRWNLVRDFVNVHTGQVHDIEIEPPSAERSEHVDGCLCARAASVGQAMAQAPMAPPSSLAWGAQATAEDVKAGQNLGRRPVRCRGCRRMTVFHGAAPKRVSR